MKKCKFTNLAILLICFVSLNAYGQRKEISREDFVNAYKNAGEKTKTLAFRVATKNEIYRDDDWQVTQFDVSDFIPPERRHNTTELTTPNGNKILTERIIIGNDEYIKANGGDWVKRNLSKFNQSPDNPIKTVENNSKFYLTQNIQFENQTVNLYEVSAENKITIPNGTANTPKEITAYRTEKRWISRDGLLLKMELEDKSGEPRKFISRRTFVYSYDPNVKIEAPVLKADNKN